MGIEDAYKTWVDIEDTEDLGVCLNNTVNALVDKHKYRINKIIKAISAYDNLEYGNIIDAISYKPIESWNDNKAITFNTVNSSVDTLLSKIGKNKILPRIITTEAKWSTRDKANKIEKFIRGLFKQLKINERMEKALFSCLLHGDGFVKICNDGENIAVDFVYPEEILVDFIDAAYGEPSAMYQTRIVSIKEVCAQFPEKEDELSIIYSSNLESLQVSEMISGNSSLRNKVCLVEAWHLAVGNTPGRHVIICGNLVLLDEEWDRDYFPFVHLQYSKPERGYYSKGMYHILAPIQKETDFTFQSISDVQRLCSAPKILVKRANPNQPITAVSPSRVTNKIAEILELDNVSDYQIYTPPPLNGERFAYLQQLKQLGYEQVGVSQLSATSRLPVGIDGASGKALREYNNIETERFALLAQEWERAHAYLGEILIKEVARNPEFLVKCYDRNAPLEIIKFSDLQIELDNIVVSVFPASSLPSKPEARFAAVQEWIQSGYIDKESAMELLDIPDLDAYTEITNAPKKAADKFIDMILEHQVKMTVEPFFNLPYLQKQAIYFYNHVFAEWDLRKKKTQKVLQLLLDTIEDVEEQLRQIEQPEQPEQTGGGLPPGLTIKGTPEMAGIAAAEGTAEPGINMPELPPEAAALIGGLK